MKKSPLMRSARGRLSKNWKNFYHSIIFGLCALNQFLTTILYFYLKFSKISPILKISIFMSQNQENFWRRHNKTLVLFARRINVRTRITFPMRPNCFWYIISPRERFILILHPPDWIPILLQNFYIN